MKKITLLLAMVAFCWQANAQFTEGFETDIPATWTVQAGGGANGWVQNGTPSGGAQEGAAVASITFNATAHDDYLITPAIAVAAATNDRLSMYVKSRSATFLEPYEVLLSTTDTATASFTVTLQASSDAPNAWTPLSFNLSAYVGQTVYVAVHATGTNKWQLFVDDVVNDAIPSCTQATVASSTVMPDCMNSQFSVDVDVTTLGDATEITDGTTTWTVAATGVTTAGPFADGVTVSLTLTHSDAACNLNLGNFTYICPPVNDMCANATVLVPSPSAAKVWSTGTTLGNTASGQTPTPTCSNFGAGRDVWYTVEVPAAGDIIIETQTSAGTPMTDNGMAVYSGTCGTLTEVGCDDDSGAGAFAMVTLTGQTAGAILYVRVFEYNNAASKMMGPQDGAFEISAHAVDATLGVQELQQLEGFNFYPNPVTNVLKVSAQSNIESLQIVNMLGQVVKTAQPNMQTYNLDMSSLATGVYFIKASVNNVEGTFRIVKQ